MPYHTQSAGGKVWHHYQVRLEGEYHERILKLAQEASKPGVRPSVGHAFANIIRERLDKVKAPSK